MKCVCSSKDFSGPNALTYLLFVFSSMIFGTGKAELEESPVSEGLREAISSYLYMTEELGECDQNWDT